MNPNKNNTPNQTDDPYAEDRAAIDEITAAFFSLFTNAGGIKPPLHRIYELCIPEAVIIKNAGSEPEIYNLKSFIEPREIMLNNGELTDFSEAETESRTDIFGNIAQRFCAYEKSGKMKSQSFHTKGMKSIQFIKTPQGWKISAVAWDDERKGLSVSKIFQ